jgi:amino acid transporter
MSLLVLGCGMFCAISILCAASRATWAFARDRAMPFHHTFSDINTWFSSPVPLNAFLLSTTVQLLLGLIYLGSSTAFNAFAGVAVVCLGASYAMPVAISLCNGRKDMKDTPFSLGRWGTILNGIAVIWILFAIVLFSMPVVIPVTEVSMSVLRFIVIFVSSLLFKRVFRLCQCCVCRLRSNQRSVVSH